MNVTSDRRAERRRRARVGDRRPAAPQFEVTYAVTCDHCGHVEVHPVRDGKVTLPSACVRCRGDSLREEPLAEITNSEDYPGGLTGVHIRRVIEGQSVRRALYERRVVIEDYAETGEPHEYDRVFDRGRDEYRKRYTNLVTGEVPVDEVEPLSKHQGRGAGRLSPEQGSHQGEAASDE